MSSKAETIDDLEIEGLDEDTVLITSARDMTKDMLRKALSEYSTNTRADQRILNSQSLMKTTLTEEKLAELAWRPQESVEKTKEINSYIDYYLNKDDIIGRTYDILEANTNSKHSLTYPEIDGRNKKSTLKKVKEVIDKFNKEIGLEQLIIDIIPHTYTTGNRILYLRKTSNGYIVDKYPLGVAQITSFKANNEPVVVFSIAELISRMSGGGFSLGIDVNSAIYKDLEEEVRNSYPKEVYAGYLNGDTLVKLDTNLSGVIRTNNRDKQYGLSPIFKALNPALKLEIQEKSDSMDSKARAKKIIFQKISDKLMGENGEVDDLSQSAFSNEEFKRAWQNEVVLYTGAPWVDNVSYVEPKNDSDKFNTLTYYRSKVLSALGISFLNSDSKTGVVTSEMNLSQLMRTIDKISKQLEDVLYKWYHVVLEENGLPVEYAPEISILDSELLEMNLRMQLADNLFTKFGMSFESTYEMLGMDYGKEVDRRKEENRKSTDKNVFYPRETSYTYSGSDDSDGVDNKDVQKTNKTTNDKVQDVKKVEEDE